MGFLLPFLAHVHCERYVPHMYASMYACTYARTYDKHTPPALCLGTPVSRQKWNKM